MSTSDPDKTENLERRFPRRLLLTGGVVAAAAAAAEAMAPNADASSATTAWVAGGNSGITTNGTNFLGTKNVAPLIFKTAASSGHPAERLRIKATGEIGIGTNNPVAPLDVLSGGSKPSIRARYTGTSTGVAAVSAASSKSAGVVAASTDNAGVIAKSTNSSGLVATGGSSSTGAVCDGGYSGVRGEGGSYGGIFYGTANGSYGLYANGQYLGVYGSGDSYGLRGSSTATGVYGSGSTGVEGLSATGGGKGVYGHGGNYGLYGSGAGYAGAYGASGYIGTFGEAPSYGAYGHATGTSGTNYGVFGKSESAAGWAVWSQGNMHVAGTLSKLAGSFKIDHPLDPENKWLSHSFVESPDMMNVYNGNVVLDKHGKATVDLPDYFGVLNTEYRYQLTTIGGHAPVYISREVADNSFEIAGGTAGLKVSWQVTGIRQDDYAKHHPIEVETQKTKHEVGMREFVAPGSSARQMRLSPAAGHVATERPNSEPIAVPTVRRPG